MGALVVLLLIIGGCYFVKKSRSVERINEDREYMDSLMGEHETKKSSVEQHADTIYNFMRRKK